MIRKQTIRAWRRALLLCAAVLVGTILTNEAGAETYVILSMVGDHLTVVGQRKVSGTPLDANDYEVVPISDTALDDFAVRTADAVIAKARPNAGVVTVRAGDPSFYNMSKSWLDADVSSIKDMVASINQRLPPLPDPHLVLITPYRDQPNLRATWTALGTGKVSGLGFYIDATTWLKRADTNESSRGFLGVFANFQLVLIDLLTGAIEGHERVVLGTTRSSARAEDRTPWNTLTPVQKTEVLQSLMKEGIEASLPRMLAAKKS